MPSTLAPSQITSIPAQPGTQVEVGSTRMDQLYDLLVDRIPAALEAFCMQPLARFQWKSRAATGAAGQLDVSLQKVTRNAGAQFTLDFQCTAKAHAPVAVSMIVTVRQTKPQILAYKASLNTSVRYWECAVDEGGELKAQAVLTRPNKLSALEHFAAVWFGNQQDTARHGVAAGVERVGNPILDARVERFWPRFSVASKKREWGLASIPSLSANDPPSVVPDEWAAGVLVLCLWTFMLRTLAEPEETIPFDALARQDAKGLPPSDFYWPRRSVDLSTDEVQRALSKEGFLIPWHVIEAACSALNSGKQVIFTGPPGCGKSKLAGLLATLATGREPLMVTASPAWTSGDLIGRYFPRRKEFGLEFRPGFFLRAIDDGNRWLVIDEFNRANIDECFGELFSVLADDLVELPFEDEVESNPSGETAPEVGIVRIIPARRAGRVNEASSAHSNTSDYTVGPGFRMIGTMNDADRSSLHQLSYALLRRFHIIRVEAPSAADVQKVIDAAIERATSDLMLKELAYRLARKGKKLLPLELDMIRRELKELFARSKQKGQTYTDLVQERVVGLATVQDIIRFVAEGIRGSAQKEGNHVQTDHLQDDVNLQVHAEATCASFLAIAIALSVFPQLDALGPEPRQAAIEHILGVFQPSGEPILMRRVESAAGDAQTTEFRDSENPLKLALIDHTDPTAYDLDDDRRVSIGEFLLEELSQKYRGQAEAREFRDLLEKIRRRSAET